MHHMNTYKALFVEDLSRKVTDEPEGEMSTLNRRINSMAKDGWRLTHLAETSTTNVFYLVFEKN